MRTKPVSVRRTEASVNSGLNFGKASKISAQIRKAVAPINPASSDLRVLYRLTAAVNKFIAWKEKKDTASIKMPEKLPYISGFQFNDQADLSSMGAIRPTVKSTDQGVIEISLPPLIPTQSLQAPINTKSILFRIILIAVNLYRAETEIIGNGKIEVLYSNGLFKPPVISITNSPKPGDLVIVVMAIQYMVSKNGEDVLLNDNKKMPCGVVWQDVSK